MSNGAANVLAKQEAPKLWLTEALDKVVSATSLDGSNNLVDEEDIEEALAAIGIYGKSDDSEASREFITIALDELGLKLPLHHGAFTLLVRHLQDSQTCVLKSRRLPYSQRAVSWQQLLDFHIAFVDSGWLSYMCEENPKRNLHRDFNALDELVVRPLTQGTTAGHNARSQSSICPWQLVVAGVAAEAPTESCSYAELLNHGRGLDTTLFVSHAWDQPLEEFWAALHQYVERTLDRTCRWFRWNKPRPSLGFWLALLALDQHRGELDIRPHMERLAFHKALLRATDGLLLVLDPQMRPLRRLWCLYEVYSASQSNRPLLLGLGGTSEDPQAFLTRLLEELQQISPLAAGTAKSSSRVGILFAVLDAFGREIYCNMDSLATELRSGSSTALGDYMFTNFAAVVKAYLARPLLNDAVQKKDSEVISQCLAAMSGLCSLPDLATAEQGGFSLQSSLLVHMHSTEGKVNLQYLLAQAGSVEPLRWLLAARNANPNCMLDLHQKMDFNQRMWQDTSPLHVAASAGHVATVRLLLSQKARAGAKSSIGFTPLHMATRAPSEPSLDIVLMLVRAGAVPTVADAKGGLLSPLHMASGFNKANVAMLLIELQVDVNIRDDEASTPLCYATGLGHESVTTLLLENRGDPNARRHDGKTSLHRAAQSGHLAIMEALLLAGADAGLKDEEACTPGDVADQAGWVEAGAVLRQHAKRKAKK